MKYYLCLLLLLLAACMPVQAQTPTAARTTETQPAPTQTVTIAPAATTTPYPTATALAACVVTNTGGDVLNIRKRPSMTAEIIGGLLPGQRATVLEPVDDWRKIRAGDVTGYVYAQYCEVK